LFTNDLGLLYTSLVSDCTAIITNCSLFTSFVLCLVYSVNCILLHFTKYMKRAFRKYHRTIGIIICLPLILTVFTGMLTTIIKEWPINTGLSSGLLLRIHTGEILHLEAIYPILNGLGLIGLLVTGLRISGLFDRKKQRDINN
jgi:hypothetical protein